MILHVYKKMTGKLNMADIENQFVSAGADPHRFPLFYRNRSDFHYKYIFTWTKIFSKLKSVK